MPDTDHDMNSEDEERADLEFAKCHFPSMLNPRRRDSEARDVYENITFYPGYRKIDRLKHRWVLEHPEVCQARSIEAEGEVDGRR